MTSNLEFVCSPPIIEIVSNYPKEFKYFAKTKTGIWIDLFPFGNIIPNVEDFQKWLESVIEGDNFTIEEINNRV